MRLLCEIKGVTFDVEFSYQKPERETLESPAEPASVEIELVGLGLDEMIDLLSDEHMSDIEICCLEHAQDI